MIVYPHSKINIGLNVVERRPDGYHNLETVFYPIMLQDALEIHAYETSGEEGKDYMLKVSEVGNKGRYIPGNWVPHMAVAMKMGRDGLYKGFERLSEIFIPFCAEINRMALIKCEKDNPYQELVVYGLN